MLPAENARVVQDAPGFAAVERGGLLVEASGNDWTDVPADLSDVITPVRVRIVNHSGRALRVLYGGFKLTGAHGRVYRAIPPVPLLHETPQDAVATVHPYFAPSSFFVRRAYKDIYPSLPAWPSTMKTDEAFYAQQYASWTGALPTREMQRMGLPEGVVAGGGQISGFVYFEDATPGENKIRFEVDLADGETGAPAAAVTIPFRVE